MFNIIYMYKSYNITMSYIFLLEKMECRRCNQEEAEYEGYCKDCFYERLSIAGSEQFEQKEFNPFSW